MSGDYNDQPIWTVEQNALIYPDQPFWVIPWTVSPLSSRGYPDGEDPLELPRPLRRAVVCKTYPVGLAIMMLVKMPGQGVSGSTSFPDDLGSIESYKRIGDAPIDGNSFITLVDWWVPGESILVLDGDNPDTSQYLSEYWRGPAIWSLIEKDWLDYPGE